MIRLRVNGKIEVLEASEETRQAMMKALRLKNPTFHQAIRANPRAKFALSEWIKYYELRRDGQLVAPRGVLKRIEDYARRTDQKLVVEDKTVAPKFSDVSSLDTPITLRDYQRGIPEIVIGSTQGVLRLGVGFGKTVIGLETARQLRLKTLVIVPTLDLFNQWVRETKAFLPLVKVGQIQGKNLSLGDITIATIQSLSIALKCGDIKGDEWGLVLLDEVHRYATSKAMSAIGSLAPSRLYGLTGTLKRSDGQGEAIKFLCGEVLVDRRLEQAKPTVRVVESPTHIWVQEYGEMITELVRCPERNKLIAETIKDEVALGRKILVLTKRVEHYELLEEMLKEARIEGVYSFSSAEDRDVRSEHLAGLRSGKKEFSVLLGTVGIAATGLDIPKIDTVVFACDLKSEVLVEQGSGRALRLFSNKKPPLIIDIVDTNNLILKRQARERMAWYQSEGWEIA